MNLEFSYPRLVNGLHIQTALPTKEFWGQWRNSREEMGKSGIHLQRVIDDRHQSSWIVKRVYRERAGLPVPVPIAPVTLSNLNGLLDYQPPVVSRLIASILANRRALDCSDTGTGKTYMALKTALELGLRPGIICTRAGIVDWKKCCRKFGINPLFIINWESAKGKAFKYVKKYRDPLSKAPVFKWLIPDSAKILLIFDEIHRGNGANSQNQELLLGANRYPILGLSATLADKMSKFRGIGILLGLFKERGFNDWLRQQGLFKDKFENWQSFRSREDMLYLSKFLFPYYGARVRKSDVPGFPEVQNIAKLYQIGSAKQQNKAYKELEAKIAELKRSKGKQADILVLQLRYRQMTELLKVNLLVEIVKEHIENGLSVALFVNFKDTLNRLKFLLKTNCIVQGGQKDDVRAQNIADFQADKKRVIILNTQAGGVSISLHDLRGYHPRIAVIAPTYNPVDLYQVLGRIHRAGALSKAINLLVYAAGTIEERVYERVVEKIGNIMALNDGPEALEGLFEKEAA